MQCPPDERRKNEHLFSGPYKFTQTFGAQVRIDCANSTCFSETLQENGHARKHI